MPSWEVHTSALQLNANVFVSSCVCVCVCVCLCACNVLFVFGTLNAAKTSFFQGATRVYVSFSFTFAQRLTRHHASRDQSS